MLTNSTTDLCVNMYLSDCLVKLHSVMDFLWYIICCFFYYYFKATQCSELDCVIPLQFGITKMVLVGDPEQLPATVLSKVNKKICS